MDQNEYSRILTIGGISLVMIFLVNSVLCLYYYPVDTGGISSVASSDIDAAIRAFWLMQYTAWFGIFGFIFMMFGKSIKPISDVV